MLFSELRLIEPLLRAVCEEGYSTATPIQAQAIPHVIDGRDLLGVAQTGTGKTAAFALPILQRLSAAPRLPGAKPRARCLVLCPTRELASQIGDSFRTYGRHLRLSHTVIFGGVGQGSQVQALRHGVDIIVATPGRLLDLIEQHHCDLRGIEVLVLDEADRMLDMGFIHDVRKIVARLPGQRQTLFFSATMPREIRELSDSMLKNPAKVQIAVESPTVDRVEQSVYFVKRDDKPALLAHLFDHLAMTRAIVFTRTKHGADRVVRRLHTAGIRAEAIHGNKSQNVRERALNNFRKSKTPILVATDIAARGIDIDDVSHVVNYDLTHEPETYVHRIGRTARAGAAGKALSFCDAEEVENLRAIERLIRKPIPVETDQPMHAESVARMPAGSGQGSPAKGAQRGRGSHLHASRPRRPEPHVRRDPVSPAPAPQPFESKHTRKRLQPGRGAVRVRQHPLFA